MNAEMHLRLIVCIPTYRRALLLQQLLEDISLQTVQPQAVIIIDGDPASGEVLHMLTNVALPKEWCIVYLPSNHSNAPFQRYLGWRVASELKTDVLLYLDDDLRLHRPNDITKVIAPFSWDESDVVGVTAELHSGDVSHIPDTEALREYRLPLWSKLIKFFRLLSRVPSGGISPVGHRRLPVHNGQDNYAVVQWLRGGVMAFRMDNINQSSFSRDAFAMAHVRCGLGVDDTVLSRAVGSSGRMLTVFKTGIDHPGNDTPKAYPYQARQLAYATAYSRRFLNDHYRSPYSPTLSDRLALFRNYMGVTVFAWLHALASFKTYRFTYALGYTQGAVRGLIQKPTAEKLTPHIDWWADAAEALKNLRVIQG